MFVSSEQNAGQNNTINTNLAKWKFQYFGMIVNQHCMYEEIKSRLNSGKATIWFSILCIPICYLTIYINISFPFILCGCETWSLTLRYEQRLWVF